MCEDFIHGGLFVTHGEKREPSPLPSPRVLGEGVRGAGRFNSVDDVVAEGQGFKEIAADFGVGGAGARRGGGVLVIVGHGGFVGFVREVAVAGLDLAGFGEGSVGQWDADEIRDVVEGPFAVEEDFVRLGKKHDCVAV